MTKRKCCDAVERPLPGIAVQDKKDATSQYELGLKYASGNGVLADKAMAVQWFRKAAEQGDANGQWALGEAYGYGDGVAQNHEEAEKWCCSAALQAGTCAWLAYRLGTFYRRGEVVNQNTVAAVEWYRNAANRGLAEAQFDLGLMYEGGLGVPKEIVEGMNWCRMAAKQGLVEAQFHLGHAYYLGKGVAQDKAEAVKWLHMALAPGDADDRWFDVSENGTYAGVPEDMEDAAPIKWCRFAAELGVTDARFLLGYAYEHGEGVHKDRKEAMMWYRKAANLEHVLAEQCVERITGTGLNNRQHLG